MASVRYLDRKLIRNIIHHTETHNRLQEEGEMWRNRRTTQQRFGKRHGDRFYSRGTLRRFSSDPRKRLNDQVMVRRINKINSEPRDSGGQRPWDGRSNRDIFNAELGDQERWGHTGFMELYPEEFINKESMDEMSDGDQHKTKKKKKKMTKKHKRKISADHKEDLSHKRRRTAVEEETSSSDSSTDSDSSSLSSSSASSSARETKLSVRERGTKCRPAPHHQRPSSRQINPRRAPSIEKDEAMRHKQPRVNDGSHRHRRAPSVQTTEQIHHKHGRVNDVGHRHRRAPSVERTEKVHKSRARKRDGGERHKLKSDGHQQAREPSLDREMVKTKRRADEDVHRHRIAPSSDHPERDAGANGHKKRRGTDLEHRKREKESGRKRDGEKWKLSHSEKRKKKHKSRKPEEYKDDRENGGLGDEEGIVGKKQSRREESGGHLKRPYHHGEQDRERWESRH